MGHSLPPSTPAFQLGARRPRSGSGHQRVKPCGHHIPVDQQVRAKAILGGLHHEYSLERRAA